jgi:hypothetical protein
MDWTSLVATYTDQGQTFTVGRPALVFEMYGHGPTMAPHGGAIFDRFLDILPEQTELHVLGNNDRQYNRVTTQSLRRIRQTLAELEKRGRFYSFKDAPGFDVGRFSFEVHLGSKHEALCDTVVMGLPVDWGSAEADRTAESFASFVRDCPFWTGVASYGYDMVWGREFEQEAMPVNMQTARRFHGLLVRNRPQENYFVKTLKSAGWLTYLNDELVGLIGGETALRAAIGPDLSVSRVGAGLLLRTGAVPPLGDVNRQDPDVVPLRAVSRAIAKVRLQRWPHPSRLFKVSPEDADAWLHRLD